ncbi:MAG: hypothetical protein RLZZ501_728 [Pseudomonadota bacterium]|jgi:uncharacterized protein YbjT (DUF2867 family)
MTNILILGAHGRIARVATALFLADPRANLTLYLRDAVRLGRPGPEDRVRVVEGDVLDLPRLKAALTGQDVVYANLDGALEPMARAIVKAMAATGVRRLIFVASMGIYDEVPGQHFGRILDPYRQAARVIEASDLDYTLLRPAWLDDRDEVRYGTTQKGEPFKNPTGRVSRKSVADLIVQLAMNPGLDLRCSLGVHHAD